MHFPEQSSFKYFKVRVSSLNYKNITEMLILWDPDCILDCFFQWGVGQNFIIPQVPILGWEYSHHNFHCWKLLANTEVNSRSNRWARNSHCHCLAVGDCPLLDQSKATASQWLLSAVDFFSCWPVSQSFGLIASLEGVGRERGKARLEKERLAL